MNGLYSYNLIQETGNFLETISSFVQTDSIITLHTHYERFMKLAYPDIFIYFFENVYALILRMEHVTHTKV